MLIIAGLLLLGVGGELLVRAAARLAQVAGLTPAVIGLTVVAIGTSLPELVVSVTAASTNNGDLALANVLGSNVMNITGTLGLAALIMPLPTRITTVRLEWPVLLMASLAALIAMRDGTIDRFEGAFFMLSLIAFMAFSVHIARRDATAAERAALADQVPGRDGVRPWYALTTLAFGLVGLIAGGDLLVTGAVRLARSFGVTERIIGLTVVAIGTGAPETAATVVAAVRKQADMAWATSSVPTSSTCSESWDQRPSGGRPSLTPRPCAQTAGGCSGP